MSHSFICAISALLVSSSFAADGAKGRSTVDRLDPIRLEAVNKARTEWAKARKNQPGTGIYDDYKAVLHVHAEDSNHTGGKRPDVLDAAKKTGVKVVMFSDHRGPQPETWRGLREGILFLAGSEDEGVLRYPIVGEDGKVLKEDLRFVCHPEERYGTSSEGFQGMEIYNRHTDAKDDVEFIGWIGLQMKDDTKWAEFVELFKKYPDEIFGSGQQYWSDIFKMWDNITKTNAFTGVGANDAHQNQVFKGLMLDPYEVSFRNLSTHILARELSEASIRQSLHEGHAYVSHDWLCDPTGFTFVAANNLGVFNMGDTAWNVGTTRLVAQSPIPAKIKLFKDGELKEEQTGERVTFETKASGTYRVEAWLEADGEERPWIYSNPVYLNFPDLLTMALPSMETKPNVEILKNITYAEGKEEDASKHKLDVYKPKGKERAPVFLFIHGGAWVSGDRGQYPPLGNRYASEGILTVVPSYRLAPKNPFPAQIDDVAAAFAWVVKNIEQQGGDPSRIYVGGHSAGGHLTALLALDPKHLEKHGLTPSSIKGAICLSGVYDVADVKEKVFGTDKEFRKAASPMTHIREQGPPFLITYCEWDYFPLGVQAKDFHAALSKAGRESKLVFVPKENHISEMLAVSKEDDLTVRSVMEFVQRGSRTEANGR
jgi:acetyl esterase/lipase